MAFMAARQHLQHYAPSSSDQPQQRCARGAWCSAKTRDEDGEWHPALAAQPLCPADQDVMKGYLAELPPMHQRLAELSVSPARRSRPVRTSPGSRVLVSAEALALMDDMAAQLGVWAARVRDVPQLSLSRPAAAFGTQARIEADCGVLATHPGPMLALPPKDMIRTWWFTPSRDAAPAAAPVPCRRCGTPVTLSPSGRLWWPARCAHAGPLIPAGDRDAETGKDSLLACAACGTRLPPGWQPAPACRHSAATPPATVAPGPVPAEVEDEIAALEVVRAGYDWVQCLTPLGGTAAALDVIDLRNGAYRLLREAPAQGDVLDGVPCRACDAMSSLEVLPQGPPDPAKPEEDFSQCSRCRDRMTRPEYRKWVAQYEAYAKAAGLPSCRRCASDDHASCQWRACPCRASDPARHARKAA